MATLTKSSKILFSFKIDRQLKDEVSSFFEELDIPISTYINAHLRSILQNKEININLKPELKDTVLKDTKKALEDYQNGKLIRHKSEDFLKKIKSGKI